MGQYASISAATAAAAKPLVIIDMNKLLVFRAYRPTFAQEQDARLVAHIQDASLLGEGGLFYTWKRPCLDAFIEWLFAHYEVAVWSSAWRKNVDSLCEFVFTSEQRLRLLFEWDQSQCDAVHQPPPLRPIFTKPLAKVWAVLPHYNASNTLIVDDSLDKMAPNPTQCTLVTKSWSPVVEDAPSLIHIAGDITRRRPHHPNLTQTASMTKTTTRGDP